MGALVAYRGPDDEGYYRDEGAILGMRRLSIIDLAGGSQPIANEDKSIQVILNGEIYNYKELQEGLIKGGHRFSTCSDTEVLAHLYEEKGVDFVHHLRGMFAIALWDRNLRRLVLVRDRLGKKPLYYRHDGSRFIFGSELKTILADPYYKKGIDFEALYHYFSFKNVPSPLTIFSGIMSLEPGHLLVYEDGKVEITRYWKLIFKDDGQEYPEEYLCEKILALLKEAVQLRTFASDVPVGAYLSGGLDSSLVVALMSQLVSQPIKTFSLGYKEKVDGKSDVIFARKVSNQFGTEHYEYQMSFHELPEKVVEIARHFDEPFAGVISTYFISRLIRQQVKVALSGDGADELFGSYAHHRMAWPIHNYLEGRKEGDLSKVNWAPYEDNRKRVMELAEENIWDWRIKFCAFTDEDKQHLFARELRERCDRYSSKSFLKNLFLESTASDPLNAILDVDLRILISDQVFTYVDRLSMAHSIEVRIPFMDHRLVEFIATIPGKLKIKNGETKYILKKTAEKILPKEVVYRPKEGFIFPTDRWILGGLRDYTNEVLAPDRLRRHGLLNHEYIDTLLQEHYLGHKDHTYKIWTLIMFQVWYEQFFG